MAVTGYEAQPNGADSADGSQLAPAQRKLSVRRNSNVIVSASTFMVCWWCVCFLHVFVAVFTLFESFIHLILSIEAFDRATSALLISIPLKRLSGLSYLVAATLHLVALGRMLSLSVKLGALTLHRPPLTKVLTDESRLSKAQRLRRRLSRLRAAVFGSEGYLGINGPLFTSYLLLREALEVAMQSYQLWTLSRNVSRAWINNLAMAAVVINCFSIPIVNAFFHKRENTRRLMHFVVDMQLDVICTVLVPVCVIAPYPIQFDWTANVFPIGLMLDNVWFANAVSEARQTLVTSYTDYFSSLLPHYSIYSCLGIIKRLVHRSTAVSRRQAINPMPTTSPDARTTKPTPSVRSLLVQAKHEGRWPRLLSIGISLWGVVLLGLHLHAQYFVYLENYEGCALFVKPWLVTKVACSVMVVNCYQWMTPGSSSDLAQILNALEETTVTRLVFAHCSALAVPREMTKFSRLGVIEIFNSTLVDWPEEAAVRQSTHPAMSDIYFTDSNVSAIPPAFLHSNLPRSLGKIAFFNCSLAAVPEELGDLWSDSQLNRVGFEYTELRTLPASFGLIDLRKLWLVASPIAFIADDIFADRRFSTIRLSGLPLQRLPETVGDTSALKELLVEYTNVSSLPLWVTKWLDKHSVPDDKSVRSFFGSPVCDPSQSNVTAQAAATWRICDRNHQSQLGEFPRDLFQRRYPLY